MRIVTSADDFSNTIADAVVLPADSKLGIDTDLFLKGGPSFEGTYDRMLHQQQINFPLTEPTVQNVEPGVILNCKGVFLVFPGTKSGKKNSESDTVNVLEAYNLLMDQIIKLDYKSVAIILSPTDSKDVIAEILYSVVCRASKVASFDQVTIISNTKSLLKTTRSLLSGESRELISQKETDAMLKSLMAASKSILKNSTKIIDKKTATKRKDGSICYFSTPHTKLKMASGYVLKCSGTPIKLGDVKADVELYGAENALDLLILRGSGEQIKWDQNAEAKKPNPFKFCLNGLLCRLPNATHEVKNPVSTRRLTKEEAVRIMNATGILCHVGANMCNTHFTLLDENRLKDIEFEEQFIDFPMKHDEESSEYTVSTRESSVVPVQDTTHNAEDDELEKKVQEIAHLLGLSRLTGMKWNDLQPAVKEKKINSMIRLINGICRVTAGEQWEEFRSRCVSKMGCVEPDNRVTEIMSTISSALDHCSKRTVRNQILSLVTGIFSERVIMQCTGCTSYDIRQAKLSAKRGFEEVKEIFRRDKGGREMLKEFVSFIALPDVTMCMPSIGRTYKLENGEIIELAKVVRTYSYHELFRMFLRFSEKKAIDEGKATAADVDEFVKKNCLGFSTAYKIMEVVVPVRRKRLQCIDKFQADSIEAFEYLNQYVDELADLGTITAITKADLLRRSRVSSNFISYDQRVHMEKESDTINHCICYLLSDPKNKNFATTCDLQLNGHSHDQVCQDCLECTDVFDVFLEILRRAHRDLNIKKKSRKENSNREND